MEIRILLPGFSAASDRALAPKMAALAVADAQHLLPTPGVPASAGNACSTNPACKFLGNEYDDEGKLWAIYLCDDVLKAYSA